MTLFKRERLLVCKHLGPSRWLRVLARGQGDDSSALMQPGRPVGWWRARISPAGSFCLEMPLLASASVSSPVKCKVLTGPGRASPSLMLLELTFLLSQTCMEASSSGRTWGQQPVRRVKCEEPRDPLRNVSNRTQKDAPTKTSFH